MKALRSGLLYDTDTAILIAEKVIQEDGGIWWKETLYRTKNHRYFIVEIRKSSSDNYKIIRPIDYLETLGWCEKYDVDPDVIIEHLHPEEA